MKLHPTLKACKCGYINSRSQLYKHFDNNRKYLESIGRGDEFTSLHGESVLNENDPRVAHAIEFLCATNGQVS